MLVCSWNTEKHSSLLFLLFSLPFTVLIFISCTMFKASHNTTDIAVAVVNWRQEGQGTGWQSDGTLPAIAVNETKHYFIVWLQMQVSVTSDSMILFLLLVIYSGIFWVFFFTEYLLHKIVLYRALSQMWFDVTSTDNTIISIIFWLYYAFS